MSTQNPGAAPQRPLPKIEDLDVAIVVAEWNGHITSRLLQGALQAFQYEGYDVEEDIDIYYVPGAVELTFAAQRLVDTGQYDAVIVFGCVVRGGTPHFEYVCQSVTEGITHINREGDTPVIFGVLTTDNEQDALDRAGGKYGNKGIEAAQAAIKMIDFNREVEAYIDDEDDDDDDDDDTNPHGVVEYDDDNRPY